MGKRETIAMLLAGAGTMLITQTAAGQGAAATPQTPDAKVAQTRDQEIIVTGSRVITNGNNSPMPVTVVPVQDVLRLNPSTVADALNTLPVFIGSRNQVANPGGGTSSVNGGGNASGNNLNLRGLGPQRTLILYDGHRVPPGNQSGTVDVDMIPQQLLQRVDVVTGGASAVYGSDAVTGVVNFVTDTHFKGVKLNAQYGLTQKGDDISYDLGIAAGRDVLDGRGHIEGSYEYRDDKGVPTRSSRGYNNYSIQGLGTAASPYYLVSGARNSTTSFGGLINSGVLSGQNFTQNGTLSTFNPGTSTGVSGVGIGGDGVYYDLSLKSPLRSHQAFARFDYDLTDAIHVYASGAFNDKYNSSNNGWPTATNLYYSAQNAYLASTYQSQLAAANQSSFRMSKVMQTAGQDQIDVDSRQIFATVDVAGKLGSTFKWDLDYVHSTARLKQTNEDNINLGRFYAALDAVNSGGSVVCNVTITNPGLYPGCTPINMFGPTNATAANYAWFVQPTHYVGHTKIDDLNGSITGSAFSTWAGAVNVALSGEYRRTSFYSTSDAQPGDLLNCTGLRYNCTATTATFQSTIAPRSLVSQTVKEVALETDVPLLKDSAIGRSFNLNGAVRFMNYDTSGSFWAWKIGADWQLTDELRLRGTRSRDVRAPTLDDLYAPTTVNTTGTFADLLTNTNPTVTAITSGNPNLTAEIGNTLTAGVVYKPHWMPGLSIALDYYDIKISNAVLNLLASNATLQRACYASGGTSPFCALQTRPGGFTSTAATNVPTTVYNTVINVAKQTTNGFDLEMNYATHLFARPASFRLLTSWQPHYRQYQPGLVTLDYAGVAYGTNGVQATPKWRLTGFVRVSPLENLDLDLEARYRSSLKYSADPTLVQGGPNISGVAFVNMNVTYQVKAIPGQPQLFLNISNLFNTAAPAAAFYGGQASPGQFYGFIIGDDPLGRAFTFGVRARF